MTKLSSSILISVVIVSVGICQPGGGTDVDVATDVSTNQFQQTNVNAMGGSSYSTSISEGGYGVGVSDSDASSSSQLSLSTTSNYQTRTPPLTTYPGNLPFWNHGGWGTIKGYFSNGPNSDELVYERLYDPEDPNDMREIKGILTSLPQSGGIFGAIGGFVNGVVSIFVGGQDNYHHGRGFEIANALVRQKRPEGKPLLVFIDSNVDIQKLKDAGYTYVGKVSVEGKASRNWDHVYNAAVAETLPWDVDILLIAGGMKGVTTGSNTSFPSIAGGYSQVNYSLSLFGGQSTGITEGKGKPVISAEAYRYYPDAARQKRIPQSLYDRIKVTNGLQKSESDSSSEPESALSPHSVKINNSGPGIPISPELYEMTGLDSSQRVENMVIR
jgi:hypothetical protein